MHLCLDKAYNSKSVKQAIIKRGYVPHIPYKRKRGERKLDKYKESIKRYPARRCWFVWREQIHDGIIGSENCLLDMKRR